MEIKDAEFMSEIYTLVTKIEETITSYGFEDKVMSSIVVSVIQDSGDLDSVDLKSLYSFNLQNKDELEVMKEVMDASYTVGDDDLLNQLGLNLN